MSTDHQGHALLILEADGAGSHPAVWRQSAIAPGDVFLTQILAKTALSAESAGFHALSFQDSRSTPAQGPTARLDAIQRAAYLGPLTHSIGLLPVVDAIYTEPFHLATQLAALDTVSAGRAGWIISATGTAHEGAAVGREALEHDHLADEVNDVLNVSRTLWDSWEDDAVIKDETSGKYLDRSKVHYADFTGTRFSIKGPAISPRPIQGQLPVLVPETLATQGHDAVLFGAATTEQLLQRAQISENQRIAELEFVLDAAGETAASRLAHLDAWEPWESNNARFVGSAAELSAYLSKLLPLVSGVRLYPATLNLDVAEFSANVLPTLRNAGLLADISTGTTLRTLFGLPETTNQFTATATFVA